jgi:alkylation response protein AidB-like acyl-CoA dehydrogenase
MNFAVDPADEEFRGTVRAFIAANLPEDIARRSGRGFHMHKQDMQRWHTILAGKGWAAPHWPAAHGGPGWSPMWQHIFAEECMLADAPVLNVFGLSLVGPVIYTFGSDEQKARYLPGIHDGTDFWCQGFSEPGAGSDLAAVRTRAVLDGDEWVVDGHKIWTTDGHLADKIFLLVRTTATGRKQEGISFLLADMNTPGIEVRPIITIDGGHSVNEIFLDGVRVPAANLVGEEGRGWSYAKFLLANERTDSAQVPRSKRDIARVRRMAAEIPTPDGTLAEDPIFRLRLAELEADLMALEYSVLRVLSAPGEGSQSAAITSTLKIRGSELQQRIGELLTTVLGDYRAVFYPDEVEDGETLAVGPRGAAGIAARNLYNRAVSIYAGSNEIQREIIAKRILGL